MSERILITGGAGFIGSHAVDRFLDKGWRVRVLDNLATGDRANLAHVADDIEFHEHDLRDAAAVATSMADVDIVLHLGALGSVPRSVSDPLTSHDVNATGTLNVLVAARDAGVTRVVFSSSSSVFGSNRELPKTENMLGRPLSPYAATKQIGEDYCRQFHALYGLETTVVRFFNVFGPRQRADHVYAAVIPKFIDAALAGRAVEVHGDGEQSRDFTYVGNAIDGLEALTDPAADNVAGEVFHLACGRRVSLLEVLDELESLLGERVERNHTEPRAGDIRDSLADITKLCRMTGYEPARTVNEGLALTLDWFRSVV